MRLPLETPPDVNVDQQLLHPLVAVNCLCVVTFPSVPLQHVPLCGIPIPDLPHIAAYSVGRVRGD